MRTPRRRISATLVTLGLLVALFLTPMNPTLSVFPAVSTDVEFVEIELISADASPGDLLGSSVDSTFTGRIMVAGAPGAFGGAGAADVFVNFGFTYRHVQRLSSPALVPGDGFGSFVAISGNGLTIVVGAPGHLRTGAVFVFVLVDFVFVEAAILTPIGGAPGDGFGSFGDINEDGITIAVAAPNDGRGGVVYVFVDLIQVGVLVPSNSRPGDACGSRDVALDAEATIIGFGCPGSDDSPQCPDVSDCDAGRAVAFLQSGRDYREVPVKAEEPSPGDECAGAAFSEDGNTFVVTCPGNDDLSSCSGPECNAGAGVVLECRGPICTEGQKLLSDEAGTEANLGADGAITGDGRRVWLGTPGSNGAPVCGGVSGCGAGGLAIYELEDGVFVQLAFLVSSGSAPGDGVGAAVATTRDGLIGFAGAPRRDSLPSCLGNPSCNAGAVLVFRQQVDLATEKVTQCRGDGLACLVVLLTFLLVTPTRPSTETWIFIESSSKELDRDGVDDIEAVSLTVRITDADGSQTTIILTTSDLADRWDPVVHAYEKKRVFFIGWAFGGSGIFTFEYELLMTFRGEPFTLAVTFTVTAEF